MQTKISNCKKIFSIILAFIMSTSSLTVIAESPEQHFTEGSQTEVSLGESVAYSPTTNNVATFAIDKGILIDRDRTTTNQYKDWLVVKDWDGNILPGGTGLSIDNTSIRLVGTGNKPIESKLKTEIILDNVNVYCSDYYIETSNYCFAAIIKGNIVLSGSNKIILEEANKRSVALEIKGSTSYDGWEITGDGVLEAAVLKQSGALGYGSFGILASNLAVKGNATVIGKGHIGVYAWNLSVAETSHLEGEGWLNPNSDSTGIQITDLFHILDSATVTAKSTGIAMDINSLLMEGGDVSALSVGETSSYAIWANSYNKTANITINKGELSARGTFCGINASSSNYKIVVSGQDSSLIVDGQVGIFLDKTAISVLNGANFELVTGGILTEGFLPVQGDYKDCTVYGAGAVYDDIEGYYDINGVRHQLNNIIYVKSYTPKKGDTYIDIRPSIEIEFNIPVKGDFQNIISLHDYNTDENVPLIHIMNTNGTVRMDTTLNLKENEKYYFKIKSNMITNTDGTVKYAGIDDKDFWSFSTDLYVPGETVLLHAPYELNSALHNNEVVQTSYHPEWQDDFFLLDSQIYNHKIAKIAVGLSTSAYNSIGGSYNDNIDVALNSVGLTGAKYYNYEKTHKNYSGLVGHSIAHKKILDSNNNEYNLLVLTIRGTTQGEWYSNFNMANSTKYSTGIHEGFAEASEDVIKNLESYIEENISLDLETKILISGHSRGAAVANIIGNRCLNSNIGKYFARNNVFVYTYATPNVEENANVVLDISKGNGIYNFVGTEDFVTHVPLRYWNYQRHGMSFAMPSKETHQSYRNNIIRDFEKKYLDSTGIKFDWYGSLGVHSLRAFTDEIYSFAPTIEEIYSRSLFRWVNLEEYLWSLSNVLVNPSLFNSLPVLASVASPYAYLTTFFAVNGVMNKKMNFGHAPETYISWMEAIDEVTLSELQNLTKLSINCPVDIFVYDSNDQLVGKTIDNKVDNSIVNSIQIVIDQDEKIIYLAGNEEYRIEIIGTAIGMLNYSASSGRVLEGTDKQFNFYNIPLTTETSFTAIVNPSTIENNEHTLVTQTGLVLQPDDVFENLELNNLSVSVSASGNGLVGGNSRKTKGDVATVTATPISNSTFLGWYENDVLIENAPATYKFFVMSSRSLEAKFTPHNNDGTNRSNNNGGGTSKIDTNPHWKTADSKKTFTLSIATKMFYDALTDRPNNTDSIAIRPINYTNVDLSVLQALSELAKNNNVTLKINFDEIENKVVMSRLQINPADCTKNIDLKLLDLSLVNNTLYTKFSKYYTNVVGAYTFEQKESFGLIVNASLKLHDKTNDLVIYSYSASNNTYTELTKDKWSIDVNNYLCLSLDGTDGIVVAKGQLK